MSNAWRLMKMRKSVMLTLLIAINLAAISCYAIDPDTVVGIWMFDENKDKIILDSSGNNHNGEIKENVKCAKGKFDSAIEQLGQSNSYAVIPHDDALSLKTFSITAWVNLVDRGAYQALVEKGEVQGDVRNYYLAVTPEGQLYGGFKGDNSWNSVLADVVADENWHHAAVTYDMKQILVYLDGKSFTTVSIGVAGGIDPLQNEASVTIGVTNVNGGEPAQGTIDEVAIFNSALSEADIKSIMQNGLAQSVLVVEPGKKLAATWGSIKRNIL